MTMCCAPRPAPRCARRTSAAFASLSISTGKPESLRHALAKVELAERDVDRADGRPLRWSICDGMPKPSATTSSSRSSTDRFVEAGEQLRLRAPAASSSRDGARRVPSRSTRPARIFVPPRSTPITRVLMRGGYPNSPHARRRQAVPRLPRRPPERKVPLQTRSGRASARASRDDGSAYRGPARSSSERVVARPADRHRSSAAPAAGRRLGRRRLPLAPQRRREGEQASARRNRRGADTSGLAAPVHADEHPPARHRPLELAGARVAAFRLDHAHSHRSAASPHRVPLDPAGPARADRRRRRHEDQRARCRREGRGSRSRRSPRTRACRSTT